MTHVSPRGTSGVGRLRRSLRSLRRCPLSGPRHTGSSACAPAECPAARSIGFVSEVVADEDAMLPRAAAIAELVASHAPLTLRATKEALRRMRDRLRPADAADLVVSCYTSEDFREGVRVFFKKRAAVWQGR